MNALALLCVAASSAAADIDALNSAINSAVNDPGMPFHLDVFCTDAQSQRSLTVYRGKVGVWNGERQIRLNVDDRRALLQLLIDADFASFEARYGEREKADKQEAPLRVICRVSIAIADHEKVSVQLLDGDQSSALLGLAAALLDRIEPRRADGILATSLEDGVTNLAKGVFVPELLELRLLRFPEERGVTPGFILRVRGGEISRQPYVPGELVGEIEVQRLSTCVAREIIDALENAKVWDLPRNLRYEGIAELEVAVLSFRHTVSARSSFHHANGDSQARFGQMLERLSGLSLGNSDSCR